MAVIDDLVNQIQDKELKKRIEVEINKISKTKKFGLVFEEHRPECTPLYDLPIRVGKKVTFKDKKITDIFIVKSLKDSIASCINILTKEENTFEIDKLVCIAEFGEAIYPYLETIDLVENAPESSLWHTLIEADNYHALQLLEYLYSGKVDCIYIDPPYNTGAKDWKYNNDYVDNNDSYRHSKWLSMIEKRLKLAKKLLNPNESVLIITIDEKEYLHLGCLLEEMFPMAKMQMITSRINKKGSTRLGQFARCDEYIFILQFGNMSVNTSKYSMLDVTDLSNPTPAKVINSTIWHSMLRRGANGSSRQESPNLFYPVWVDEIEKKIVEVGEPLQLSTDRHEVEKNPPQPGLRAVWPIRTDNSEGRWQLGFDTLRAYLSQGIAKLGTYNKKRDQWAIVYLKKKQKQQLSDGILISKGIKDDGSLDLEWNIEIELDKEPKTMWVRDWHDASEYGSNLISKIIPNRKFPFPKSLYAVQDILRFYVKDKKDALILDFFSGSGTTLHAVNLLNVEDQGNRRCIMVTNNEVSVSEAQNLKKLDFHPGDPEWEKYGIARFVTWPRTVGSIIGKDVNGKLLRGKYLGLDIEMSKGFQTNAHFFKLGFLEKDAVAFGKQFRELLPVLWMKSGSFGKCPLIDKKIIPSSLIFPENKFAILTDEKDFNHFIEEVNCLEEIDTVFIVTDSDSGYHEMIEHLKVNNSYQLYRDYLDNFRINTGR